MEYKIAINDNTKYIFEGKQRALNMELAFIRIIQYIVTRETRSPDNLQIFG